MRDVSGNPSEQSKKSKPNLEMDTLQTETNWTTMQKILFRFFFVFLSLLSFIAYNPLFQFFGIDYAKQTAFFEPLRGFAFWLDNHIFHLGFLPQQHSIDFSDTHFGVILTLFFLIIAVVSTIVWTLLGKSRTNYNRFYFWFSNYLAYYIFFAMIGYAIEKIIPIQATYPIAPELLTRWGNLRNWEVLFRFMGTSPAYCMFCGWLELTASILILFNRTRVMGGLLMMTALIQVVCFNIFYNNNIILLSSVLLLATLFILARAIPKLYKILIQLQPVSLAQYRYSFTTKWKKYVIILLCLLPIWKIYSSTTNSWLYYKGLVRNQEKQQLYNVTFFKYENDTILPLATDTIRWKYICFLDFDPKYQRMDKLDMQENISKYQCKWDTLQHTITFIDNSDTIHKNTFSYTKLVNRNMDLKGTWHGKSIAMGLTNIPIDSMTLVKDKFLFMQEDQ